MKSRFFFNAVLISLAAAFVLPLFSCSDASNDVGSGMVSFYVDKALMQKAVELSDKVSKNPNDEPRGESERRLRFIATLEGEYNETKTVYAPYEGDFGFESFSIDFAAVPVGKTICAKIRIYDEYTQEPVEARPRPSIYGKSQNIRVNSGVNPLAVEACSYRVDVRVKIEIQFDQRPDFSICSDKYIYAVDPMSSFVAKLNNAKGNELRLYEICNQFVDKYWDDSLGEIALTDENTRFSEDGKTVTVEGDMSICVSEDDPASRAADARFVLLGQNISYDAGNYSYKTKFYGMTSSTVIPIKARENIAEFSAQKLNVIDTNYALYNISSGQYNYYLRSDPSADLSGDGDIQSDGTSGSSGTYKQSICFDANGNFYTLSVASDGGSVYIRSNNPVTGDLDCDRAYASIACDVKRNELYKLNDEYVLFGTGSLIEGGTDAKKAYMLNLENFIGSVNADFFAVYDNVAYFIVNNDGGLALAKADLSKAVSGSGAYGDVNYDITLESVAHPINLPSDDAKITDMLYQDGAVYLLAREVEDNLTDKFYSSVQLSYKSRGALIKCDVADKSVKTIGWTSGAQDNSGTGFYTYYLNASAAAGKYRYFTENLAPDWNDSSKQFKIPGNTSIKFSDGSSVKDNLPKFYSPSRAQASIAFYGPQKFIAIKPKKLVIADNGAAFYTDKGAYTCKTARRIVTVDLEKFAISGSADNSAAFESVISASIYTNSFGTVADYVGSGKLVTDLWLDNGSRFTDSSGTSNAIYLGIPLDEE